MQFPAIFKDKTPPRSDRDQFEEESGACLNTVLAFSVIGLLLAVLLTGIPLTTQFASTQLMLIAMVAPVAAWLGFTFGSSD